MSNKCIIIASKMGLSETKLVEDNLYCTTIFFTNIYLIHVLTQDVLIMLVDFACQLRFNFHKSIHISQRLDHTSVTTFSISSASFSSDQFRNRINFPFH